MHEQKFALRLLTGLVDPISGSSRSEDTAEYASLFRPTQRRRPDEAWRNPDYKLKYLPTSER
jgi:hypothetical protein